MADEELFDQELGQWEDLKSHFEELLDDGRAELEQQIETLSSLNDKLSEMISDTIPMLEEQLAESIAELESKLSEKIKELMESVEAWEEQSSSLRDSVNETIGSAANMITKSFETCVEELERLIEQGFVEKVQADLAFRFDESAALFEDSKQKMVDRLSNFREETKEQLEKVLNCLNDTGWEWKSSVSKTREAYSKLVADIQVVQRQVLLCTELMDDALSTTGIGINSATSVLAEIKGILDDIV
jgi:DNA repair exonuclease SbcCD ATPase subunit